MSNFPDFTEQGYQIKQKLGYNSSGGRITYLAENLKISKILLYKSMNIQLIDSLTKIILSLSEEERNLLSQQTKLEQNNLNKFNSIEQKIVDLETQLNNYEDKYKMSSNDFYKQFRQGKLGDDIDFFEWSVFYEMLLSAKEELKQSNNDNYRKLS